MTDDSETRADLGFVTELVAVNEFGFAPRGKRLAAKRANGFRCQLVRAVTLFCCE